jgi:hypothetical protein
MKSEDGGSRKYKEGTEIYKEWNSGTKVQQLKDFMHASAHGQILSRARAWGLFTKPKIL